MKRTVWRWELAGMAFIMLTGSALHFAFEWTGYWPPAAVVAPVNESVWEHLKLAFWPGLAFALIEFVAIRERVSNFWVAKSVALFSMPATVVILFYAYTALTGDNFLVADILIFIVAVVIGQWISYRILLARRVGRVVRLLAIGALVVMLGAFALLSYFPPRLRLFRDPVTGQYGLLDSYPVHD